jgi:hypothetical protein
VLWVPSDAPVWGRLLCGDIDIARIPLYGAKGFVLSSFDDDWYAYAPFKQAQRLGAQAEQGRIEW